MLILGQVFQRTQTFDLGEHDRILGTVARLRELPTLQQWTLVRWVEDPNTQGPQLQARFEEMKAAYVNLAQLPSFLPALAQRELNVVVQEFGADLVAYRQRVDTWLAQPNPQVTDLALRDLVALGIPAKADRVGDVYLGTCQRVLARNVFLQRLIFGLTILVISAIAGIVLQVMRRSTVALRQAEAQYRELYESALEGIIQVDAQGRLLSANPAFTSMIGGSLILGEPIDTVYVDSGRQHHLWERLQTQDFVIHYESQVLRADGTILWISENARLLRDPQGKMAGYSSTLIDITERKFAEEVLRQEQDKSEKILLNILPRSIVAKLKQETSAIAERFESVTILFADIVNFTSLASRIPATELVDLLNHIFTTFDQLADRFGLEKIKTIGDAYMVVGGAPDIHPHHTAAVAEMALAMQRTIQNFHTHDGQPFHLRIGINTGPVVAGVIGTKKFIYDLWGDAVNVASRMESSGIPGGIQVTEATYQALHANYHLEPRGTLAIKGKGDMPVYLLTGRSQDTQFSYANHPASPPVHTVTAEDVRPCGVQRPGFPITIGLEYLGLGYLFQDVLRLERMLAVDYCLSQFPAQRHCLLVSQPEGYRLYVHDPDVVILPYTAGLAGLCQRMRQEIDISDRRWRVRVFLRCFIGSEAVTWLSQYLQISRQEAVALGQTCLKQGLFSHVVSEQDFADDHYFYRFRQDGQPGQRFVPWRGKVESH
ncbi:MAG: hypothetical protein OHK0012_01760 [Synechococcales cyanobacterium]